MTKTLLALALVAGQAWAVEAPPPETCCMLVMSYDGEAVPRYMRTPDMETCQLLRQTAWELRGTASARKGLRLTVCGTFQEIPR